MSTTISYNDIDIYQQKLQQQYNNQTIIDSTKKHIIDDNTTTSYIHVINGKGSINILSKLYDTYYSQYNHEKLYNVISPELYYNTLEHINNILECNRPCMSCNVISYILAPLTCCLSLYCIKQSYYNNAYNSIIQYIQQANNAQYTGDQNAGVIYKWVFVKSNNNSHIELQCVL